MFKLLVKYFYANLCRQLGKRNKNRLFRVSGGWAVGGVEYTQE